VLALALTYHFDKFALLREWRTPSPIKDGLVRSLRNVLAVAIVAHVNLVVFYMGGWPFDGLCPTTEAARPTSAKLAGVDPVEDGLPYVWEACSQQHPRSVAEVFRWTTTAAAEMDLPYMSEDHKTMLRLFADLAVGMTALVVAVFFGMQAVGLIRRLFFPHFSPTGAASTTSFNDAPNMAAYIPAVESPSLEWPVLACDISKVNADLIPWRCDFESWNVCSPIDLPDKNRERFFSRCEQMVVPDSRDSKLTGEAALAATLKLSAGAYYNRLNAGLIEAEDQAESRSTLARAMGAFF
jgi:hypothetical protein